MKENRDFFTHQKKYKKSNKNSKNNKFGFKRFIRINFRINIKYIKMRNIQNTMPIYNYKEEVEKIKKDKNKTRIEQKEDFTYIIYIGEGNIKWIYIYV